ncbi:MAG: DNA polymerase/3'-5' exonuclease PolX [Planctomycetota bacterium]
MAASEANKELAGMFAQMARVLDLKGGGFRAVSFQKVSRLLDEMSQDVKALHDEGGTKAVEALAGIGKSSAKIIDDFFTTGTSPDHNELLASVQPGVLAMLDIPGMGPKTAQAVWQERDITTINQLSAAIADGSLSDLKGLGKKKLEAIQQGIDLLARGNKRRGIGSAAKVVNAMLERLLDLPDVKRAEPAGSFRRGKETVGDLDFLVVTDKPADTLTAFAEFPEVERVLVKGDAKCSIVTKDGLQCDCRVVPEAHYGAAMMYFTGSKEHNTRLRGIALERKHTLNDWGVFDKAAWDEHQKSRKTGGIPTLKPAAAKSEEEIFEWFGMQWVPPEMREDKGEIELAAEGKLPKLIEQGDLKGDLHTHTTASDGTASIVEMAEAAKALGYTFLAITDHSKSQIQANGLDADRLLKHADAIRRANDEVKGIELLAGTECDILSDGRLDYEDDILAQLDWVVASPHAALKQDAKKATDRMLKAIDSPYVNAIGHPTGRLINKRDGLPLDMAKVITRAKETGTALEINAAYPRLDLNDLHARMAVEAGAMLTINTDAHTTRSLAAMHLGLCVARRAWATKADVLNCQTPAAIKKWVAKKRA